MKKIVAISGYFDPLHKGHIRYIKEAKKLGGYLIIILNTDYQAKLKKGKSFMKQTERAEILENIRGVDQVVISRDKDKTVCKTLESLKPDIFANGGDRNKKNIPETEVCNRLGIKMVFGVGGRKIQSSSKLINGIQRNIAVSNN